MSHSPSPDMPIRFQRALRRATFFKWLFRLTVLLLAVLLVAGLVFFRSYLPEIARKKLSDAGIPEDAEVNRMGPGETVLDNLHFVYGPLALEIPSLTASYSLKGIAASDISEVLIGQLTATLDLNQISARNVFEKLLQIQVSGQSGQLPGLNPADGPLIRKISVESGTLAVLQSSFADISVPFSLTAALKEKQTYTFRGRLSPDQYPIRFSGEINPFTGSGKIEATANALEAEQWLTYLLPSHERNWNIASLSAKSDVRISVLFEDFSLVWAHFDCEMAGIDCRLKLKRKPASNSAEASSVDKDVALTVHSSRFLADVIPPEDKSLPPQINYSLDVKQGQLSEGDKKAGCSRMNLSGKVTWSERKTPRPSITGEITQLLLGKADWQLQAPRAILNVPDFESVDILRWTADISTPVARIHELSIAGQRLRLAGSLLDVKINADNFTVDGPGVSASLDIETRVSSSGYLGTMGKGNLHSLVISERGCLQSPVSFTFKRIGRRDYQAVFPEIQPSAFPGTRFLGLTTNVNPTGLTINGKMEINEDSLAGITGVSGKLKHPLLSTVKGSVSWDKPGVADAVLTATYPRQELEFTSGKSKLAGSFGGRVSVKTGPMPAVLADVETGRLVFTSGGQKVTCSQLQLQQFSIKPGIRKKEFFEDLHRNPEDLQYFGILSARQLVAGSGHTSLHAKRLNLPFFWKGARGFAPLPQKVAQKVDIQADKLQVGSVDLSPRNLTLKLDEYAVALQGEFSDADSVLTGSSKVSFAFGRNMGALLRLQMDCSDLSRLEWLPKAIPHPGFSTVKITGKAQVSTSLFIDSVSVSGAGSLVLQDMDVKLPSANIAFEGLNTALSFREIMPLATLPGQQLTFKKLVIGGIQLGQGDIQFQLPGNGSFYFERVGVNWCDGRIRTQGLSLKPGESPVSLDIYGENLHLGQVLASQSLIQGIATGRFNAHLPLKIHNGKITSDLISLYSSPGRGGRLGLKAPERFFQLLGMTPPLEKKYLRAFSSLDYTSWRLDIRGGKSPLLSFQLAGIPNEGRRPKPFQFVRRRPLPSPDLMFSIPFLTTPPQTKTPQ